MSSLLRRDVGLNFKSKGNPLVSVLVCNVLATAYQDQESWPDSFLKVCVAMVISHSVTNGSIVRYSNNKMVTAMKVNNHNVF